MPFRFRPAIPVAAILALSGCASLPPERGYAESSAMVQARRDTAPAADPEFASLAPELPAEPVSAEQAVQLAFLHNPRIREQYARLGLGRAELEEARRLSNPSFGYARLTPRDGDGAKITRGVSWGFADLLLWPARKRFAAGELERLQQAVAADLLELATEVEIAWYEAVGAQQIAAMRDIVAQASERSAELAQRFFDAGNITRLQLEQEYAASSQARIAAVRADAAALRSRSALADLIGLPNDAAWRTQTQLVAPSDASWSVEALLPLALQQRLDLAAAQKEVSLREDALKVTRRWRWLGSVEAGYERESEIDGGVLRGPSLSLELPIFNQGQAAIARAQAELLDARARRDALLLSVRNDARLGVEHVAVAHVIVERYRTALVPQREAIVARTQERVNYMLEGVFELILARQQEFDAYQEYLEAVRDYWIARAQLRGVIGGRLPGDEHPMQPTLGVEAILPTQDAAAMDHSMHGGAMPPEMPSATDPHAGHRMPAPARDDTRDSKPAKSDSKHDPVDPHAHHRMPRPASDDTPEAADHEIHEHGDTP